MNIRQNFVLLIYLKNHFIKFLYTYLLVIILNGVPLLLYAQGVTNQNDSIFRETVRRADQYYQEEKYSEALFDYESASKIKQDDAYINEKIHNLKKLLDEQKTKNILFEAAITSAEQWFKAGDYKKARIEFLNALKIDPKAQYPKDRLAQISKIWTDPEVEAAYAAAIRQADGLYAVKNYFDAKVEYMNASDLKPHEQYPLDRIMQINEILASQRSIQEAYDKLIAKADSLFNKKTYYDAKTTYGDANIKKPDEDYPKNKIKEIDNILASLQSQKSEYDKIITIADNFYIEQQYDKAKIEYLKASSLKSGERYPQNMIGKIDPLIAEMKAIQKEYDITILSADKYLTSKDYQNALTAYQKAIGLKPGEVYPKNKADEITRILADAKTTEDSYLRAIASGDSLLQVQKYDQAKTTYQNASAIKSGETYPKEKIKEIESILADIQTREKAYTDAINRADDLLNKKEYDNARNDYQEALIIKPGEKYPSDQISLINRNVSDLASQQKSYNEAISAADLYHTLKNYTKALEFYNKALTFKPGETYPEGRISEINQILASEQSLNKAYDNAIAAADNYFKAAKYPEAMTEYQNALSLKPGEAYPKTKLAEAEKIIADKDAEQKAYDKSVLDGDTYFSSGDYTKAKLAYQEALRIKPEENYPQIKLNNINELVGILKNQEEAYTKAIANGDRSLGLKEYEQARSEYSKAVQLKPEEKYPRDKVSEIDKILAGIKAQQDAYYSAIRESDDLFTRKDYELAKTRYVDASGIKPAEQYPKDKVAEINKILADMRLRQDSYDRAITQGDNLFKAGNYTEALRLYQEAMKIKPEEKYPKEKIDEIGLILKNNEVQAAYELAITKGDKYYNDKNYQESLNSFREASAIKPDEQYPKEKISELIKILADQKISDANYKNVVAAGTIYYNSQDYENALLKFKEAFSIKPSETYPKNMIYDIEDILNKIKANQQGYDNAIAIADQLYNSKSYDGALIKYQEALKFKPEESYPASKITEITKLLGDYKNYVANADEAFKVKNYTGALADYKNALSIKPQETYPAQKISDIEIILANVNKEEAYRTAIATADDFYNRKNFENALPAYKKALEIKPLEKYPSDRVSELTKLLAELELKKKAYQQAIADGDRFFGSQEYEKALTPFQNALNIFPDEQYPASKLEEIRIILADLSKQKAYNDAIVKADNFFQSKDYDNARTTYQNALNIKPEEPYPQEKINEINTILSMNEKARQEAYDKAIAQGDAYFGQEDYKNAKVQYQNAIGIKPEETYPKDKLKEVEAILLAREMALKEAYTKAIARADNLYNQKILDEALTAYEEALNIKSDEAYPMNQIRNIRRYLEEHAIVDITKTSVIIKNNTEIKYDFTPVDIRLRKNNYIMIKARSAGDAVPRLYLSYGLSTQKTGGVVLKFIRKGDITDYIIRVSAQDPWYRNDNSWLNLYAEGGDIEVTSIQISQGD
ncbi:MAG: hypothetical protein NT175_02780 [Bacteroidetes bacterium]|nr:hypothetical protein [Bacteroidota bacterium]